MSNANEMVVRYIAAWNERDSSWAVGCIGLLAGGVLSPNAPGVAFMLVQTVSVLIFAVLESFGLRASQRAGGLATAASR